MHFAWNFSYLLYVGKYINVLKTCSIYQNEFIMFCTVRDGMTGAGVRVGYVQAHVYFRDSFFF